MKNKCDTDKLDQEKKINDADKNNHDVTGLVKKTDFNTKVTEIEGKIPSITGLATNSALTTVENKILDISNLVTKTDLTQKLVKLKRRLVIIIKTNILLLQNLID